MSALLLSRTAFRSRAVVGAGIGLSIGSALAYRQPALRMDARAVPRPSTREAATTTPPRDSRLDPEIIRQLSGGSITGKLARRRTPATPDLHDMQSWTDTLCFFRLS